MTVDDACVFVIVCCQCFYKSREVFIHITSYYKEDIMGLSAKYKWPLMLYTIEFISYVVLFFINLLII